MSRTAYRKTPIDPSVGQRIQQQRVVQNISQEALAQAVGIGVTTLSRIEVGRQGLSVERLAMIAQALKRSADYLLGLVEESP